MPGVAAAALWTLYALLHKKPTTCSTVRRLAHLVPGGRWLVAAFCGWFTVHLCVPLFKQTTGL